ncbi:IS1595 family transposase [Empedobacter sp. GD03797]|uniref:IS1595 family transposase n=1 Tax=Empedobacter sp. GD03797 TaxID=2975382 RepID=UPI0024488093|nr:IS1595 family transposase [Empedobacter sp. GD03797]MDH1883172.1 IS1595 family transposase [Empedobacter sp. GD03797]
MDSNNIIFKSIIDLIDTLKTDDDCRLLLESLRWNNEPVCPHCGSQSHKHYQLKNRGHFNGLYKCRDCKSRFTITVGTMFESTHIPLRKWFMAIYLFASNKKGISSIQLHKFINVTQKTAWFMLSRIRYNFAQDTDFMFDTDTQADETYVGGKTRNKRYKQVANTQGRSLKTKKPVFGMISEGSVYTRVIPNAKGSTLKDIIHNHVAEGSTLITDGWKGYKGLNDYYKHEVIEHNKGIYTKGKYHTNSIECFWSQLKRGIIGIYHYVSFKHLEGYCNEFTFRYNTRTLSDGERFNEVLKIIGRRLKYKDLIEFEEIY